MDTAQPRSIAHAGSVRRWLALTITVVLLGLLLIAPLMGLAGFTNVQADPPPLTHWFVS
jgi:hypothetical protein